MSKSLGGVALPDGTGEAGDLAWVDKNQSHGVAQQINRTLGSNLVLFPQGLTAGREITLIAASGIAWLTPEQLSGLLLLAQAPGATYTLTWEEEVYTVAFAHHRPPAIASAPLWPNVTSWYTATVRLITV